ncbi:hypothetical protein [Pseudoalteromonas xiamenensis]|uniref:Uncharacterized protein n=1 Tax=Pseudoalteromonas xiamenensis TaxID=882626 RepID=A0A975DEV0_9GAMM|nr:hypothetical protein [Pseudoalteromonas xiamenensis]QTH70528.1 hypothetical protein J5O05_11190 [Pseudoalteromonas xiamenensis]
MGSLIGLVSAAVGVPTQMSQWIASGSLQACFAGALLMGVFATVFYRRPLLEKCLLVLASLATLAMFSSGTMWLSFVLAEPCCLSCSLLFEVKSFHKLL